MDTFRAWRYTISHYESHYDLFCDILFIMHKLEGLDNDEWAYSAPNLLFRSYHKIEMCIYIQGLLCKCIHHAM